MLPFTQQQFLDVFRQYHQEFRVGQSLMLMVGIIAVSFAFWDNKVARRVVSSALALLWLWMAVMFHGVYLARIFPAAPVLGFLYGLQAAAFLYVGAIRADLRFDWSFNLRCLTGAAVMLYAFAVYPALGFVFAHYYPATPTFGTPAPTVIFTLGLLMWSNATWRMWLIPVVCAAIGTAGAVLLDMPQDFGLAAAVVLGVLTSRQRLQ